MYIKMSFLKRTLRGLAWKVFNYIENNGNPNFEKNGEKFFVEYLFKSFRNMKRKVVIFDIRANIGNYSSMLIETSKKYCINLEIHLFEPTKSCFKILSEKFGSNSDVILNNFGASDVNGIAKIFYDKELSGLASLYQRNLESYKIHLDKSEDVQLKRMDEYITERNIKHIDFIKIDIEGHELRALLGFGEYLRSDFIDYIQFEYGGANLDSRTSLLEIYKFFKDRDFSVAKIMRSGLEIREYQPFMENYMYSNYVAISNKVLKK